MPSSLLNRRDKSVFLIALTTVLAVSSLLFACASLNKDYGHFLHTQAPNNVQNYRQLLAVDSSNDPKSNLPVSSLYHPLSSFLSQRFQKANKYLYYHSYSHDWSNQLIGLARAAQIAHETNRILILPPIIEHSTRMMDVGSSGCQHCLMTQVYKDATLDAGKCKKDTLDEHVSFKEVMDLSQLSKSTGVQFFDLCDFVASEPTLAADYFFQQRQRQSHPEIIDLDGECTLGQTRSYPEMVDHFNSIFGDDDVALIPSAFATNNLNCQSEAFLDNVLSFHPSSALMELQQLLLNHISQPYVSAHVSYADDHKFVCSEERKQVLLDWIEQESLSLPRKIGAKAKENTPPVYFASSSLEAAVCYQRFLEDAGLQTFTLSDLMVKEDASQMLSSMNVSADLVALILDQLLVSLGNNIILESKTPQSSAFHMIVRARHSRLFRE